MSPTNTDPKATNMPSVYENASSESLGSTEHGVSCNDAVPCQGRTEAVQQPREHETSSTLPDIDKNTLSTAVNPTKDNSTDTEVMSIPQHVDDAPYQASLTNQATSEVGSYDIGVDSNLSDTDSAMGTSIASSSFSLRESIYAYIEENGRTYHAYRAGAYHLPNDEAEQERLDLQHHLFRMTMNGALHAAPVQKCHNVLDIATGTGLWAIEFAQEHPEAQVIGTDLSPIQPDYVPPNVQFYVEDCEDDWGFGQKFDLIHGRALLSCFNKPKKVVASTFAALAPGGYFELQDLIFDCKSPDDTLEGTSLQQWQNLMHEGIRNLGKDFMKVKEYSSYMREVGFVDIVEKDYNWGFGPWMRGKKQKLQATWWLQDFLDGVSGWSMGIITKGMGWSVQEVELLLVGVRNDVKNWKNIHGYVQMYVVYGRKP